MELGPGSQVTPELTLVRQISEGAMGSVWLAHEGPNQRHVAVKLLKANKSRDANTLKRFDREARTVSLISSPHVVEIYSHGTTEDGLAFIVMELLEGETLGERLDRVGKLSLDDVATVVAQVAKALQAAHAEGIIHRDIKPENIFLVGKDEFPVVKVLDFGMAKQVGPLPVDGDSFITATGVAVGTPAYMSPEQVLGSKTVDHRSDLWALGAVAYRALAGAVPFDGKSPHALFFAICRGNFVALEEVGIPVRLEPWFRKAMCPALNDRFASARDMALAFDNIVVRLLPSLFTDEDEEDETQLMASPLLASMAEPGSPDSMPASSVPMPTSLAPASLAPASLAPASAASALLDTVSQVLVDAEESAELLAGEDASPPASLTEAGKPSPPAGTQPAPGGASGSELEPSSAKLESPSPSEAQLFAESPSPSEAQLFAESPSPAEAQLVASSPPSSLGDIGAGSSLADMLAMSVEPDSGGGANKQAQIMSDIDELLADAPVDSDFPSVDSGRTSMVDEILASTPPAAEVSDDDSLGDEPSAESTPQPVATPQAAAHATANTDGSRSRLMLSGLLLLVAVAGGYAMLTRSQAGPAAIPPVPTSAPKAATAALPSASVATPRQAAPAPKTSAAVAASAAPSAAASSAAAGSAAASSASADGFGEVSILCRPMCQHVLIDGERAGPTPVIKRRVPAGRHKVVVSRIGGGRKLVFVQVDAGKHVQRTIQMAAPAPALPPLDDPYE